MYEKISNEFNRNTFTDKDGNKQVIISECTIKNRKIVITVNKKIYEKDENGNYKECKEDDKEISFLRKYTQPPKSLDIKRT